MLLPVSLSFDLERVVTGLHGDSGDEFSSFNIGLSLRFFLRNDEEFLIDKAL